MKEIIICNNCQAELSPLQRSLTCPRCSANEVEFSFRITNSKQPKIRANEKGIWRYQDFLPAFQNKISLGEGSTPIRNALHLFKGKLKLSLKIEGYNPTGLS
ncbi:MAG: hypothetical protein ACTSQB_02210 [Candidatus Heimdallarchaeota archaeon]